MTAVTLTLLTAGCPFKHPAVAGYSLDRREVPGDNVIASNAHFTEVAHPPYGRNRKQSRRFALASPATHVSLNLLVLQVLPW